MQNLETKKMLKFLGAKSILNLGNLKFSTSKKNKTDILDQKINNFLKNKKILITAVSTHHNEEDFILQSHLYFLEKKHKNVVSIVVPRHVERVNEIKNNMESYNLKTHLHSTRKKIENNTQIYIVDTYGEVNKFYKISKLIFMGGSLINHGGQNPLEAAKFGCQIIHGPHIYNFTEIYKKLNTLGISQKFKSYNSGIKIIKKKLGIKTKNFDNKKIIKYGEKILNSTYSKILETI